MSVKTAPTSDEPVNGTGRILVVDDEEGIRALAEFALSRFGYEVVGAETASQGIELYRKALVCGQRFDLVILDLTLPGGIGGKEALKALIEIDPMVTAIVSSGYATDATRCRYEDLGFRGVIVKPYESAELGQTVRDVSPQADSAANSRTCNYRRWIARLLRPLRLCPVTDAKRRPGFPASAVAQAQPPLSLSAG